MKHILGDNYSKYPVTQKFLNPNSIYLSGFHMGTDIATPTGTTVYAPLAGNIVQCFDNMCGTGFMLGLSVLQDAFLYSTILKSFVLKCILTILPSSLLSRKVVWSPSKCTVSPIK